MGEGRFHNAVSTEPAISENRAEGSTTRGTTYQKIGAYGVLSASSSRLALRSMWLSVLRSESLAFLSLSEKSLCAEFSS